MRLFKTVLGDISESDLGATLVHEHICCYSEYAYRMAGKDYLDKDALADTATVYLNELKKKYCLATFVDCTPINIGRDVELLKRISEQSEINIICSTGFYYTDEPVLYNTSAEQLCKYMVADAYAVNAGIIKCAVENEAITRFGEKLLRACAKAHLCLGLPIVLHSNANNRNALKALEILFSEGVNPNAVTVGHLSDTDDLEYIKASHRRAALLDLTDSIKTHPKITYQKRHKVSWNFAKQVMKIRYFCPTMLYSLTVLKLTLRFMSNQGFHTALTTFYHNCPSHYQIN